MGKRKKGIDLFFDFIEETSVLLAVIFAFLWFLDRRKFYFYFAFFLLFMVGLVVVARWLKRKHFKELESWHGDRGVLGKLKDLHPAEFEEYISDLYRRFGYKTETVGGAYDGGIDVIATKGGVKHYIQCKKFITQQVGVKDIRAFYGALADHLAKGKGIFITTNVFTTEAEKFAEDKQIELIDGNGLLRLIKTSGLEGKGLPEKENCPDCGGKLVLRTGKYGKFFGCSNYPKCKHTNKIE